MSTDYYDEYEQEVWCKKHDEYVMLSNDLCDACTYSSCEYTPNKVKRKKEQAERLKSNKFAKEINKKCAELFSMTEEEAAQHITGLFDCLQSDVDKRIEATLKDALASYTQRYMDKRMKEVLDDLFTKAIEEKIVAIQADESALITTIRERAVNAIKDEMNKHHGDRYKKDNINEAINLVVDKKVDAVIEEIKEETIEKFGKLAMKKMMEGMAQAIQDDKRLLTMMTEV